jgi:prophage regulatory protein
MRVITYARLGPEKGIDYSRDHLRRKCAKDEFPKPIPISDKRIAWIEAEVDAWLAAKRQARDDRPTEPIAGETGRHLERSSRRRDNSNTPADLPHREIKSSLVPFLPERGGA